MTARDEVLDRIRRALGTPSGTASGAAGRVVPRDYRTAGGEAPGSPALIALLTDRLVDYRATVVPCALDEVPAALARALASVVAARRVAVPPGLDPLWTAALTEAGSEVLVDRPPLDVTTLDGVDAVVTACALAVATTGTIVLDAGPGQGRRALTLVPDVHVVIVRADQVIESVPEAVARLDPQRPLTLVSGPSATSDIELDRVEGVHGPRTLVVVLAR